MKTKTLAIAVVAAAVVAGCLSYTPAPEKWDNTYVVGKVQDRPFGPNIFGRDATVEWVVKYPGAPSKSELIDRKVNSSVVEVNVRFASKDISGFIWYETEAEVQRGDVVEVTRGSPTNDRTKWASYDDIGKLRRVLCRKSAPDYDACAAKHPTGFYDRVTGQRID